MRDEDKKPLPLVTIITVVLNNKELLEKTIQSILGQTYKNIEYIIIDGGSDDGSLDVIKKYNDSVRIWISEPDKGIYDAMNKGAALANGEFINFMNAGDVFYDEHTLEKIFQKYPLDAELLYGDSEIVYSDHLKCMKKAGNIEGLWKGMICTHQSLFAKNPLVKGYKFDTSLGMAADFDFIFNMHLNGRRFYYTGLTISSVLAGGKSHRNCLRGALEWQRVVRRHRGDMKVRLYYIYFISREFLVSAIRKIFPESAVDMMIKVKSSITGERSC